MLIGEVIYHLVTKKFEQDGWEILTNPNKPFGGPDYRVTQPRVPTHYSTEGGGYYSLRPDLTRRGGPGTYAAAAMVLGGTGVLVTAEVTHRAYGSVISSESPSTQRSMWRGFSQGLTGGVGLGNAGLL